MSETRITPANNGYAVTYTNSQGRVATIWRATRLGAELVAASKSEGEEKANTLMKELREIYRRGFGDE
jgi:hypothetical protein